MNRILLLLSLITVSLSLLTAQNYRVGDLYTASDGSKGIVFYVHPDGSGGWVVALDDACTGCAWGVNYDDVPNVDNQATSVSNTQLLLSESNGYNATLILREHLGANTSYASCVMDLENGWYLPSPNQLTILYGQLAFISDKLLQAGGTLLAEDWYWCTSEESQNKAWALDFGSSYNSGRFYNLQKENLYHVRAVRGFDNEESTYLWSTGDTTVLVNVIPEQTTNYTVTVTTANGCIDTAVHTVVVRSSAPQTFYDMVCQGEPYSGNGFTLTETETSTSGVITRRRTEEQDGCVATYILELTVTPPIQINLRQIACENYEWNGTTYTTSGRYSQSYPLDSGCDSVVTLDLTITESPDVSIVTSLDTVCAGEELILHTVVSNASAVSLAPPIAVGDILCVDTTFVKPDAWPMEGKSAIGIVFYVDNSGEHGWAVHLEDQSTNIWWGGYGTDILSLTNYTDPRDAITDMDGYLNTSKIRAAGNANTYPAAWAVDFDNGWYIPAAGQLSVLFAEMIRINQSLSIAGGTPIPMDSIYWYWSSTERDSTQAWYVGDATDVGYHYKRGDRLRSIRSF